MTICTTCTSARLTDGLWTTYDSPKCIHCTARLIQQLGKLRTQTNEQKTARRRVVLADAVAWGHDESRIRALAKAGDLALMPVEVKRR